jgi:photosystem II stability/assembly factor-like uncharacterized protein
MRDRRTGRYFASVTSGFYGPRLMYTDDPAGEWKQSSGIAFADGDDVSLERIWAVKQGEAEDQLWAGTDPAALWESRDGGATWSRNEALWKQRVSGDWQPGLGGLALHSICPWPGDPMKLAVGISAAGVWITDDGGESWRTGYTGLVSEYMPEEARTETNVLCVHNMHRAQARPERLFMQFHGGVYRSDDEGETWNDIREGLPSPFGFRVGDRPGRPRQRFHPDDRGRRSSSRAAPRGVRHPRRRYDLVPPGPGPADRRVCHDLASGPRPRREGDEDGPVLGATSGEVFGSTDAAVRFTVAPMTGPVTSVRVA